MPKSIRTTSSTQATTNSTLATFKAGDSVLCPSLSFTSFVLTADPLGKRELLALTHDGSYFYYDANGYFVAPCDKATGDYQPSLFKDTPANALHDVGYLLGLIYYGKIEGEAVKSMARLAHDATNTWEDILRAQLDIINEPLAMTGYSKVGEQ